MAVNSNSTQRHPPHLDHNYAHTPYRMAGVLSDQVFLYLNPKQGPANRPEVLSTALASAKKDFTLYTENPAEITEQLEQLEQSTKKRSTLDLPERDSLRQDPILEALAERQKQAHIPLAEPSFDHGLPGDSAPEVQFGG